MLAMVVCIGGVPFSVGGWLGEGVCTMGPDDGNSPKPGHSSEAQNNNVGWNERLVGAVVVRASAHVGDVEERRGTSERAALTLADLESISWAESALDGLGAKVERTSSGYELTKAGAPFANNVKARHGDLLRRTTSFL
jgi:hypothetical protein